MCFAHPGRFLPHHDGMRTSQQQNQPAEQPSPPAYRSVWNRWTKLSSDLASNLHEKRKDLMVKSCDALGFCSLGIWELLIHLKILCQLSKALAIIFYKMDKTFHPKMKKSWTAENRFQDTDPETSARFPGSDVTWNTHFLRSGDTPCRTMTLESLTINQWRDWSLIIWVWEQH